ncbi:flagellar hook-basal body complex protein FliE [Sphingomonas sp.]|uniref:flagellar hook-basal body complex protein FliE n=1 Tax=Sphingomonas sp. TaxID=28214 RepID=UPI0025CD434F|nr:flagellar hook-basal body complex protein FliE [Sphingomonas sp.]
MSAIPPIAPVGAGMIPSVSPLSSLAPAQSAGTSFGDLLAHGLQTMETKLSKADELVKRFAVDDSVPVHQVTFALEEARLSVELAMQVRARITEAYRDLMNMQL